jgi:hypothetical protein
MRISGGRDDVNALPPGVDNFWDLLIATAFSIEGSVLESPGRFSSKLCLA